MRQIMSFNARIFEINKSEYKKIKDRKEKGYSPLEDRNYYILNTMDVRFTAIDNTFGKFNENSFGTLEEAVIYLLSLKEKLNDYRRNNNDKK